MDDGSMGSIGFSVIVAVVSLIMHNKFSIDKVKGIRFGLEGIGHHLPHSLWFQLGKIINMFYGVLAVRNAETEIKVKRLEQLVAEKVSFNHAKFLDGLGTHREIDGRSHFLEPVKESGSELS